MCVKMMCACLVALFLAGCAGATDNDSTLQAGREPYPRGDLLIEASQLAKPDVARECIVLDARPRADYVKGHIPGARWLDADVWAAAFGDGKDAIGWSKRIGDLGIRGGEKVVVYDDVYTKDAARIWWILKYWGVDGACLLNGGWTIWKAHNLPTETTPVSATPVAFTAHARTDWLATKTELLDSLKTGSLQIVDARSAKEFCGEEKLTNQRAGAIPGAKQLEWIDLLDKKTHLFKPPAVLRREFKDAGISLNRPTATHCQSGGRGSVMDFTMELMGAGDVSLYYPGWSEWGNSSDTPIVVSKPGK